MKILYKKIYNKMLEEGWYRGVYAESTVKRSRYKGRNLSKRETILKKVIENNEKAREYADKIYSAKKSRKELGLPPKEKPSPPPPKKLTQIYIRTLFAIESESGPEKNKVTITSWYWFSFSVAFTDGKINIAREGAEQRLNEIISKWITEASNSDVSAIFIKRYIRQDKTADVNFYQVYDKREYRGEREDDNLLQVYFVEGDKKDEFVCTNFSEIAEFWGL